MNNKDKSPRLVRFAVVASCLMISASSSKAALIYHVDINTAPLVGSLSGPFSLDFQLTDGSGTLAGVNTVTLSNFIFTGGTPTGSASLFGGATGSLSSTVTLTDGLFFSNEFFQGFSAGTTKIGFDALLTTNVDPGPTPDAFSLAILDNTLSNIPTTGLGDSLMLVNINSASLSLSAVQKFTSTSPSGVTVSAVPEPNSWLVMGSGLMALGWLARLRNIKGGAGDTAS
jgi:hypothetical protein